MTETEFADKIRGARKTGHEWGGFCPGHDDQKHKSLSWRNGDKGLLVKCHAGCTVEQIAAGLGLRVADFFFDPPGRNGEPLTKDVTYDFSDETGTLLYQEVRLHPKGFTQRRPDGKGGWIRNLNGVRRVLYRLPDLQGQKIVHIAEGPKDASRLWTLSLAATTNSGGAGKWTDDLTQQLKAAGCERALIFQDNDVPGDAHAEMVARSCLAHGLTVTRIRLPGFPPLRNTHGEDVSDWLNAGHTKDELLALLAATPALTGPAGPHLTDLGNGIRFVSRHHANVRYCSEWAGWLVWDGTRWQRDTAEVMQRAKETALSLYADLPAWPESERGKVARWATQSEGDQRLRAMLSLAQSEPGMPVSSAHFDADPWLLNVANATIDLTTGQARPHDRADLLTKRAPVAYDPKAACPRWLAFLDRIFAGRAELIAFVQRALGYALTGDIREQAWFLFWGQGENGKSTLLRTVHDVLGDYALSAPVETFMAKHHAGIPNDLARLRGCRFVDAIEVDAGRRLAEGLVKAMTGGDMLTARFLHQEFFDFAPVFKLFIGTNAKPTIRGTDHAMWRRIRLVPFTVQITEAERDPGLSDTLRKEASGILGWLLAGCLAWQQQGLGLAPEVAAATAAYRSEQDVLGGFLAERCVLDPAGRVTRKDLYAAYKEWAEHAGERHLLTEREFTGAVRERGFAEKNLFRRGEPGFLAFARVNGLIDRFRSLAALENRGLALGGERVL